MRVGEQAREREHARPSSPSSRASRARGACPRSRRRSRCAPGPTRAGTEAPRGSRARSSSRSGSRTRPSRSSAISSQRARRASPTLFTSTSSPPKRAAVSATARAAPAGSARSAWMPEHVRRAGRRHGLAPRARGGRASRPHTATRAPASARRTATARPMPAVEPVTRQARSSSPSSMRAIVATAQGHIVPCENPGVEDYTQKYKGEQVELALFGGEYQDGVLTAYCLRRRGAARRAQRAHPDPAAERRVAALLEPLRRARRAPLAARRARRGVSSGGLAGRDPAGARP